MGRKWNLETMNEFCKENAVGYKILDQKSVDVNGNKRTFALVKCPNQDHEAYWTEWDSFRRGNRCKKCYFENANLTSWNKDLAYNFLLKNGYRMLNKDDFKNSHEPIYCYDNDLYIYKVTINGVLTVLHNTNTNTNTNGFLKYARNEYAIYNIKRYCELNRPDYTILSNEYYGYNKKHLFMYLGNDLPDNCDRNFYMTISYFINKHGMHPDLANKSKGECRLNNLLEQNNIDYISQKQYQSCRFPDSDQTAKFDFLIISDDSFESFLCEVDSDLHTGYNGRGWNTKERFLSTVNHDLFKNQYAWDNNIIMKRIPTEFRETVTLEDLLSDKFTITPQTHPWFYPQEGATFPYYTIDTVDQYMNNFK